MERFLKSRYRIGEKIGESPYSLTYKGTFLANETPLIVKIYKRGTLNSALIQTMKQKVKELSMLNHPNLSRLYDGDYGWQGFYYVRQYVSGSNLRDVLKIRKKLEVDYAVSVILNVMEILKETHRRGIIHGALKPSNIFVDQRNVVKVTDFVIEGAIKESLPQKAASILMDRAYISPEEMLGCPANSASDIFVAGLIFREMLCGQAFLSAGRNYFSALRQLKIVGEAPKYVNDIIYKALQEDPLLRFDSIEEMSECLQNKSIVSKKSGNSFLSIELEDSEMPEVKEAKAIKAENKRSFRLFIVAVLSIIAGLVFAVLSIRF